jgi:cellulose synthase/poly-beta-1,6-N-acetylglucosamine synthase-like glycosyltransferase
MKLTILICAYNEEKCIGALLENLGRQRLNPEITEYEIIVVASGCTDKTIPIVRNAISKNPRITLIEEAQRMGKAEAINRGLKVASGDVIVLIPADVLPLENALYNLLLPFKSPEVTAVTGQPIQNPNYRRKGITGFLMSMAFRIWGRLMRNLNDRGLAAHCSGEFMAIRRGIVESIPEECVADDSYIAIMAKRKGIIKFEPKALCYNNMPSNIVDYIKQRKRWLFGHLQTQRLTGEYPTVMDTLIFRKPKIVLEILCDEIKENPKNALFLLLSSIIEAIVYALAVLDRTLGRSYAIWPVIKSTKVPATEV